MRPQDEGWGEKLIHAGESCLPSPVKNCGWFGFLGLTSLFIGIVIVVCLATTNVIPSPNAQAYARVEFRLFRTNNSNYLGAGTNYTTLNLKLMAVQLVEDLTDAGADVGDVKTIFTNANCTNTTLDSCDSADMTYYDMHQTDANIRTQMSSLGRNYTIKANFNYWYLRLIFCKPGDTQNTTQYKFSQMNITKSWQIDGCNVTSIKATTPINVRNRQGAIITATFNESALFHESYSDPGLTTLQYNLTKVGPFWVSPNNHYYWMEEPVFTPGFVPCTSTFDESRSLACGSSV